MIVIEEIKDRGLCKGCGICAGICPSDALCIQRDSLGSYRPFLDVSKCKKCGLCTSVCPAVSLDLNKLNELIFGKVPDNAFLGNFTNFYVGYSTNSKMRWDCASGGLVTSLLVFALEEGIIDGALVTRMRRDRPLETEAIIARSKDEIISGSKSKYCPVSFDTAIKKIIGSHERFAIVGLPCHMQGIRKAEMIDPKLRKKIVLHFGLFCSHIMSFLGTEILLQRLGVRKEDVTNLEYRGGGWPGRMLITLKDGREKIIPFSDYSSHMLGSFFFTPLGCMSCKDATNELSDISFGDAWLPELRNDRMGKSIVITRTEVGEKFIREATHAKKIATVQISEQKVLQSQWGLLEKKTKLAARKFALKLLGCETTNSQNLRFRIKDVLFAILTYLNLYVSTGNHLQTLLRYVPNRVLRGYNLVYYTLYARC
jgi:coenzyme F420 hydrogenase subunit beta